MSEFIEILAASVDCDEDPPGASGPLSVAPISSKKAAGHTPLPSGTAASGATVNSFLATLPHPESLSASRISLPKSTENRVAMIAINTEPFTATPSIPFPVISQPGTADVSFVRLKLQESGPSSTGAAKLFQSAGTETAPWTESASSEQKSPQPLRSEGERTRLFREKFYPNITPQQWDDWRWQAQNRIRTLAQFERMLELAAFEREALIQGGTMLPVGVTPYYMSLLDPHDPHQPLRKTVLPSTAEFLRTAGEADDPLGEDGHSPVPGLVHRYPDRVLLLALDFCSTYCRYCTRSRVVGHGEIAPSDARLEKIFHYLENSPQVRDVLISGGDPLALKDEKLGYILKRLRAIKHIEFVRIGSKMPAVLPQRITPELAQILKQYHPLWMSLHFLHPDECTPESKQACERLADAGIPLGSQTVLLKGVNDNVETMKGLVHRLLMSRVRPYYLYQCDPISGSAHFRTSVSKGLEIIAGLRGHTTGYAVPTYVIDAPGGGGKIPLQPEYLVGREGDNVVLKNFEGKTFLYPDPEVENT